MLIFILILATFGVEAAVTPVEKKPIQVRVRIAEEVSRFNVRGYDLKIQQVEAGDKTSEWTFSCKDGVVNAAAVQSSKGPLKFDFQDAVHISTPAGFLHSGSDSFHPYRGNLWIYANGSSCEVVNEIDMEKYLDGLVNSEFSSKWSEEAIAAQVIAARTYAYYQVLQARKNKTAHFDLDSSERDQVYNGTLREDFQASRVVEKTRGMILISGSAPIKAFYHSTCGGLTELPERVWGISFSGLKKQVRCPFCTSSPRFRWTLALKMSEIGQAFMRGAKRKAAPKNWPTSWAKALEQGLLLDLRFRRKPNEDRVDEVVTVWADGKTALELPVSGAIFRDWIGASRLRSTSFEAIADGRTQYWHFRGKGNGHGVGMCQWGAKIMGDQGHSMANILKHYYPDAVLEKRWP